MAFTTLAASIAVFAYATVCLLRLRRRQHRALRYAQNGIAMLLSVVVLPLAVSELTGTRGILTAAVSVVAGLLFGAAHYRLTARELERDEGGIGAPIRVGLLLWCHPVVLLPLALLFDAEGACFVFALAALIASRAPAIFADVSGRPLHG
jgi:hypothetical protein